MNNFFKDFTKNIQEGIKKIGFFSPLTELLLNDTIYYMLTPLKRHPQKKDKI